MDCTLRRSSGRIYVVERLCNEDQFCCVLCPILCVVSLDISSVRLFFVLFIQHTSLFASSFKSVFMSGTGFIIIKTDVDICGA